MVLGLVASHGPGAELESLSQDTLNVRLSNPTQFRSLRSRRIAAKVQRLTVVEMGYPP